MDFTSGVNMVISVRIVKLNQYHRLLAAVFGIGAHFALPLPLLLIRHPI
jgi:hypothetical protein